MSLTERIHFHLATEWPAIADDRRVQRSCPVWLIFLMPPRLPSAHLPRVNAPARPCGAEAGGTCTPSSRLGRLRSPGQCRQRRASPPRHKDALLLPRRTRQVEPQLQGKYHAVHEPPPQPLIHGDDLADGDTAARRGVFKAAATVVPLADREQPCWTTLCAHECQSFMCHGIARGAASNAKVERRGTATRLALYSWRIRSNAC